MSIQALEQILELVPANSAASVDYTGIDIYTSGASQMNCGGCGYNGCLHDKAAADYFRMRNEQQPFQMGYDLPGTGTQLHLHGPDSNIITHGHIVPYGHQPGQEPLVNLNGYDASMAALRADNLRFKKFP